MKLTDIKQKGKEITWENLVKDDYISREKADIALHPATKKVIVGAKQCGKTFIGILNMVKRLYEDPYYNGWAFRKYLGGATKSLGTYLIRVSNELDAMGYEIPHEFKLTQSELYLVKNKQMMTKNQIVNFSSLDDYSGTTDGKPVAFGYVGDVIFDEAVVEKDALEPDKIPTANQWDKTKTVVDSNLGRYTEAHLRIKPELRDSTPETTHWYFMNNWGDHPEILAADEVFPEKEFIEWVLGQPLESIVGQEALITQLFTDDKWVEEMIARNTLSKYDEENDTLYTRMTVFGNPVISENYKKTKTALNRIRGALIEDNIQNLCIYLGMRQIPRLEDDMRVYPEQVLKNIKMEDIKDMDCHIKAVNYGVDVDISRVLTITPVYSIVDRYNENPRIYIDKQIELPCAGAGVNGTNLDQYTRQVQDAIIRHIKEHKLFGTDKRMLIDDNQQFFLRDLAQSELNYYIKTFNKPIKTGNTFDINGRQNATVAGFMNDLIIMHPENTLLINDFRVCEKATKYDTKRKTTGTTNYLDRIDSFEYGLQPFTNILWRNIRGGR